MAAPVQKDTQTQDVGSAVYLVELYLPSGLYKFAVRQVEVKLKPQLGGDFGGAHGTTEQGDETFGGGGFGQGGMATG